VSADPPAAAAAEPPMDARPISLDSARIRKCALQGLSSLHVFAMPITGLPDNWDVPSPIARR